MPSAPLIETALAPIPVLDTGPGFPLETLLSFEADAHALFDLATRRFPAPVLRQLDRVSLRWLEKWENDRLPEIKAIAERLGRPGSYFFAVNYEWGCTCRVAPSPAGTTARLVRVLDWRTEGLGRHLIAANVAAPAGRFVTLTWPGYTGVLSAMAPGRFAAALNQAPMRKSVGFYLLDWAANRRRVWAMPHPTPTHLLRSVFETASDFAEAKHRLATSAISTPAIFTLAGVRAAETVVIERTETEARLHEGANVAANHWQTPGWRGHARGVDSGGRAALMHAVPTDLDPRFRWLVPPILNARTRLAMVADAAEGRLVAQGFEGKRAATKALELTA